MPKKSCDLLFSCRHLTLFNLYAFFFFMYGLQTLLEGWGSALTRDSSLSPVFQPAVIPLIFPSTYIYFCLFSSQFIFSHNLVTSKILLYVFLFVFLPLASAWGGFCHQRRVNGTFSICRTPLIPYLWLPSCSLSFTHLPIWPTCTPGSTLEKPRKLKIRSYQWMRRRQPRNVPLFSHVASPLPLSSFILFSVNPPFLLLLWIFISLPPLQRTKASTSSPEGRKQKMLIDDTVLYSNCNSMWFRFSYVAWYEKIR